MRTIFKYPVPITDRFSVTMPGAIKVLHVELQGICAEHLCTWQAPPFVWHLYRVYPL